MDDTQRNLAGGAGIALGPAAIAWATLFPSGSWVVRVLPAVAMAVVGTALFLVAFSRGTGGKGRWFKRKKKIDPAMALAAQERQKRDDRLKQYLNELYQEGQMLLGVTPEMGFADQAETWALGTYVILDSAIGELIAGLFINPIDILPGVEIDPKERHIHRLNSLHWMINSPRTFLVIKETFPLNWEPNKQVTTGGDDA